MPRLSFLNPGPVKSDQPWFIYFPGMDGTGQLFHTQSVQIKQRFNLRCLVLPADDLGDWDQLVDEVIALIEAEQQRDERAVQRLPIYLCGESFGACLALKLALQAPDLYERMILINPASSLRHRPWLGWGVPVLPWLHDLLYQTSALTFLPWLAALDRIDPRDRLALLTAMRSVPQATSAWRLSLLRQFQTNNLHLLQQPILLIASGRDRLLPSITEAKYLNQQLPQSQMVILPESGHACLLEQQVNLYQILAEQDFLPLLRSGLAAKAATIE
jgi:pimeloyl-ACP methyl ester carboxylesterase